ncbi:MAG: SUMF1/EgtB/PvdO family nonheme iron enzyme [Anaerolineae bacterium]|nr:SUMF1/EgtB/PvdO family nonheme iron enzyme [Anaerolineae bacterium]
MLLSFDRTNFPLIAVEAISVEVHLLPVTKWQFEQFVPESGLVNQSRYQEMLALNPAVSLEQFTLAERERLFVTGILPQEALDFAGWLGAGFDLPTVTEWRAIYAALRRTALPMQSELSSDLVGGPAGAILDKFTAKLQARSMLDFSLMQHGLVEWARQGHSWVGLGAPRPKFQPHLWDPLSNEVKPIRLDERLPYFGFRLVRRGEWYLADKGKVRYVY